VDYAYYLKGLASFPKEPGAIDRLFSTELVMRDPKTTRESFEYFSELIKRYPQSQYADDARQRMVYLRNKLADYELKVAEYYMKRGAYVAAANRAQYIIEHYSQTPAMPDTLALMVQAYQALGITDLAKDAMRVLALNYPDHPAAKKK
jgi:outer membrane protein assembly factor BamD